MAYITYKLYRIVVGNKLKNGITHKIARSMDLDNISFMYGLWW